MGNFLTYMWQLLLIIACFTGIIICVAIVIRIFINAFNSTKRDDYEPMIYNEYMETYNQKRKKGLSHEQANQETFDEMTQKYKM